MASAARSLVAAAAFLDRQVVRGLTDVDGQQVVATLELQIAG